MENKIYVAVVAKNFRVFNDWLKEQNHENTTCYYIDTINKARGMYFNKLEKLHGFFEVKDIYEIL